MRRVEKLSLFEVEVRERLSRTALDVIFAGACVMSEGQRESRGGKNIYCGSTMLTFDLSAVGELLRAPLDARSAQRMAALLASDSSVATRAKAIAMAEVERAAGARPRALQTELRARFAGTRVFLDVDVEASLP